MKKVTTKHTNSKSKVNTLRADDEVLISVLQSLPVGVIIYTLDNILFANNSAFNILNFDKKQESKLYKLSIFNFLLPEYHQTVKSNIKKIISGKPADSKIYKLLNQKKQEFSIEVKSNVIKFNGIKAIQAVFTDVSDRIKIEEALLENNQTLKLLSQNYSDVIFKYDFFPHPHVKFISDSVYKLLGRKPHEIYKDPLIFMNQIHKDDLVNFVATIDDYIKVSKNAKVNKAVFRFFHKNGKMIYLENSVSPVYDDKKKITGMIGMMRDITNEKHEELLRKETEEKFRLIAQNANDIIFFYTYHPTPKYLYLSPSIKKVLGFSENEFYKNPNLCYDLVSDVDGYRAFESKVAKQQKNNSFKDTSTIFQYKTKSGKLVWLEDNYSPIYDENGKIKFILGISRDITKERNTQLELEQKWINYQNLLDNSPIGIFIHKGICLYANKTAANILDYKNPKQLEGKYLIDFIIPELQQTAIDRMKRAQLGEELSYIEYKVLTRKGREIDVELKTVPFVFNGEPCVQTIISDISAEKELIKETIRAEVAEDLNKQLIDEIKFRKKIQKELVTQTTKYEAIFNNTAHLIATVNIDLIITSFNQNYFNYVKSIFNHEIKVGDPIFNITNKKEENINLNIWKDKLSSIFKNDSQSNSDFFEIKNFDLSGNDYYREIYLHPLKNSTGEVEEVAIIGHEITKRKKAEQKIVEQSATLKAIFDSGDQLIWTVNRNYALTSFNHNFYESMYSLYGEYPEVNPDVIYNPTKSSHQEHQHNWWISRYDEVFLTGKGIKFTVEQTDLNKKKYFRQIFINPIINNGKVNEISCISYDITELKYLQSESELLERKLSTIFDSTSHLIWTVDKNYNITTFNKNFAEVFEKNYNKKIVTNVKPSDLLDDNKRKDYTSYWHTLYDKVFNGERLKFERKEVDSNGNELYREIFINPIRNQNNEIIEVACLAHDITENKNFENKIINQSAKLNAIFDSGSQLIWTVDKNLLLTSYNNNYYNLIKNGDVKQLMKKNIAVSVFDTIESEERKKFWLDKYQQALNGNTLVFVHKSKINGSEIYREIYINPIVYNKNVVEVSVIAQDITERIINEQKILNQSAKLNAIFESGTQLMWTIDRDFKITSLNQNYADAIFDLYGFYPKVGNSIKEISNHRPDNIISVWDEHYSKAFNGIQTELTTERVKSDGKTVYRKYYLYPIKNIDGVVVEVSGIGFDITDNKLNEARIIQSLKEKEILLKEVHHRVKNNMQVISSILNLQSSYVKDNYALNLLKECQNRVKSMAFIHESLYQTKNFESVNFSEYVTTLTKNLIHTYSVNTQKIKLILTLDKLYLNLDTSIPCGLIINEIISNSLKYAFPDSRDGIIFVNLRVNRNKVTIEAGDNGIGIPADFDIKQTQTLGLQLVDTLIEQINGSLVLDRTKGTKFIIDFKI